MSASTGAKVLAVIAFVVIGLPAGLCTLASIPALIGPFFLNISKSEAAANAVGALILGLVFAAIFYFLLRWVIRVFSS